MDSGLGPITAARGEVQAARSPRPRVMMVAGEASGDLHGGELAREILAREPACDMFGIAGERMRAAGVRALVKTEEIAGLGLAELAPTIGRTVGAYRMLRAILKREPPNLLILIDYAEFNLLLAGAAHRLGVPVLYYILPQVWAWRRGRIDKLIDRTNRMAVVFPFEQVLYARAGDRVSFVGHPLLERVRPAQGRIDTLKRHQLPANARLLAVLPGSRRSEIRYLLRPLLQAARVLCGDHGMTAVIALAPTVRVDDLRQAAGDLLAEARIVEDDTYSIIAASDLALVASGTATLETALLGCPMVIAYKVSRLTFSLARVLVRGVDFVGMPNILAGHQIVPELIQEEVTAQNLVRAAEPMLDPSLHRETAAALLALNERLGAPGAAGRVATIALEMIA